MRGHGGRRTFQTLAAVYALTGGAIAAALIAAGLFLEAFAAGLIVTLGLAAATAHRRRGTEAAGIIVAYSLAFVLVLWPFLVLVGLALWGGGE